MDFSISVRRDRTIISIDGKETEHKTAWIKTLKVNDLFNLIKEKQLIQAIERKHEEKTT